MSDVLIALRQLADDVGATVPQVKYWCRLLGIILIVRARVACVEPDAASKVREMAQLIANKMSPRDAAAKIGPATVTPLGSSDDHSIGPAISNRLECIERAMLAMAEAHSREATALRQEIARLSSRLEAPTQHVPSFLLEPPQQISPWIPEPQRPRIEGWRRWVAHLTNPESLRRR